MPRRRSCRASLSGPSRGESVIIARGVKPVAKLVPADDVTPKRQFGAMRGRARVTRAFFDPLPEAEFDRLGRVTPVRLLLDTHTLLWWLDGDRRLSRHARTAIADEDNAVFVSAASAWELATKARLGKLPDAIDVATDVAGCLARQGFLDLPITVVHAQRAGSLRIDHRDPFDRMLIAQAQMEDLPLVTNEEIFDAFAVTRIW